jgi:hypothetical protein
MPIPAGPDLGGLPTWAPSLDRVAAYCTARTLVPQTNGANVEQPAFSSTTRPTAEQVAVFVADACTWLLGRTGNLHATLEPTAAGICAIRAAGFVEMRYPERQSANRDDAITTGKFLLQQADQMLAGLIVRNEALTGTDPAQPVSVLPYWSFPAPCDTYPY